MTFIDKINHMTRMKLEEMHGIYNIKTCRNEFLDIKTKINEIRYMYKIKMLS